ncbi:hypothetical protein [Novosphingobium sp. FKTRR1]|uniref:hypothetical protein n=1 Tax=Novosphingobium sp. FKTRR1 TaxID=2879118 RepID=UPI001CEFE694|nr:hypothetical protein [Novosphingobium sp. FKTRR1]
MRVPIYLARVLAYVKLSPRTRVQPEDAMCVRFANELRAATLDGRLRGVWFHPANELCYGHRTGVRAAISRAMGMHIGVADFVFQWADGSAALEAKYGKNGLTAGQDDFRAWCEREGVRHRVFRSVEEGLDALREWGVLV